jgi:hypothetical protein
MDSAVLRAIAMIETIGLTAGVVRKSRAFPGWRASSTASASRASTPRSVALLRQKGDGSSSGGTSVSHTDLRTALSAFVSFNGERPWLPLILAYAPRMGGSPEMEGMT